MTTRTIRLRGDDYTVYLASDGNHIVDRQTDPNAVYWERVRHGTGTWQRAVKAAEKEGTNA